MIDKIRGWINGQQMIKNGDGIVVGVSGGADSVALLVILAALRKEYRLTLSAVHVNHGIRGEEAEKDAEYTQQLCERYAVPFFVYGASVPALSKEWKMSEEAAGRKFRYQCFWETVKKTGAACVATAHHMGDQAETVLFHMARGSNLSGVAGIRPVSVMEENGEVLRVIRPLLCCEKEELTGYLEQQGIDWREDATNTQVDYARNKIRHQALPVLREINSRAVSHIAELAQCLGEYEAFFERMTEQYIQNEVLGGAVCETDRDKLRKQDPLLAKAVIYHMIAEMVGHRQDITGDHVQSVYALLSCQSGKRILLPGKTEAVVSYNKLFLQKAEGEDNPDFFDCCFSLEEIWNNENEIRICLPEGGVLFVRTCKPEMLCNIDKNDRNYYTKVLDCDTIKDTLHVRNPLKEDYFVINAAGNHKRIARYFIDSKIPADRRRRQVLVTDGNEVLWHVGGRKGERGSVNGNTERILCLRYEGGYDGKSD